jgi:hypothetical protein
MPLSPTAKFSLTGRGYVCHQDYAEEEKAPAGLAAAEGALLAEMRVGMPAAGWIMGLLRGKLDL